MTRVPGPRRHASDLGAQPVHPDVDLAEVSRLWAELEAAEEPTMSVDEILDRNYHDTIASYDPDARLSRWLDLTVHGDRVRAGSLDIGIAQELFHAFSMELDGAAATEGAGNAPRVELAGVSRGSAVLHLVPTHGEDLPSEGQMPLVVDRLDAMLERITELHQVAEAEGDLRQFGDEAVLLKGLHELTKALDRHDLELRLRWRSATGAHRHSELTTRARSYVRRQWEDETERDELRISGRVVSMDLAGTFDLKTTAGRRKRYTVHVGGEEDLLHLHLNLGDLIHVTVAAKRQVNRLGLAGQPRYELIGFTGDEPTLDEESR
jgi:hypothetical protein